MCLISGWWGWLGVDFSFCFLLLLLFFPPNERTIKNKARSVLPFLWLEEVLFMYYLLLFFKWAKWEFFFITSSELLLRQARQGQYVHFSGTTDFFLQVNLNIFHIGYTEIFPPFILFQVHLMKIKNPLSIYKIFPEIKKKIKKIQLLGKMFLQGLNASSAVWHGGQQSVALLKLRLLSWSPPACLGRVLLIFLLIWQ